MMAEPVVVTISHRLGKQEATRRLRAGLGSTRANFGQLLTLEDENWRDDGVEFRVRALGQSVSGSIDIFEDTVRLEVALPWLLAKFAEKIVPTIRKQGQLLLEKK